MITIAPTRLEIIAEFEIFKIKERVFQIGALDSLLISKYSEFFNVINLGFKFVPSCFFSLSDLLLFFNYLFEDFLINLNKNFFLNKNNFKSKQEDSVDPFEKIIKNLRLNNNKDRKFPLQIETIEYEFEVYKELSKTTFSTFKNHLSIKEFKEIKTFIKNKPFKVVSCDKNVGSAIISHELYHSLSILHLDDKKNFTLLSEDPLELTQTIINNKLIELVLNNNISKKLAKTLLVKKPKLGSFNILPKIHKQKFGTRPIINSISHPTSNISQFIDFLLQPFVRSSQSFIKDSQNLIQKLEKLDFPDNIKICSLDFESLYSNIDLKDALKIISEFMKDKLSNSHINSIGFFNLLSLLFENNVFKFSNRYYKQITGIAMGSKCGPTVANIYLSCLEKSFLFIHKPLFYGRYIDDILCILYNDFDINLLLNFFGYLKLNLVCDEIVNFLDLNISYDKTNKKMQFSMFIKPTNTFSYLLTSSNHPEFIIKNLPTGIFIRIRRINSCIVNYYYFSTKIANQLASRGYDINTMNKTINNIASRSRNKLLEYKEKKDYKKDNIILCRYFDFNFLDLNFNLLNSLDNLSHKFNVISLNKFQIVSKMQPNIGAIIINNISSFIFDNNKFKYSSCLFKNCKVCNYGTTVKYFLELNNNIRLFFKNNSNCKSVKFVYIIRCTKCSFYYIGQSSKSVKDRISQHIYSINSFKLFNNHTPVSNHFNSDSHNISNFTFYIYQTDLEQNERLLIERKLIKLFLQCNINLMNLDRSNYFNLKSTRF